MKAFHRWGGVFLLAAALIRPAQADAGARKTHDDRDEGAVENFLCPGSWSLQFQLDRGYSSGAFGPLDVSVKRHLTAHSALRFGVGIDLGVDNSASDHLVEYDRFVDEWVDTDEERDRNGFELLFEALYLGYLWPDAKVSMFLGAGPVLGFSRETSDLGRSFHYSDGSTSSDRSSMYNRGWTAGGLGVVGAECFVTKRFSIHAEYRISLLYERMAGEQKAYTGGGGGWDRTVETTTREWSLDAGAVLLGLSAYF